MAGGRGFGGVGTGAAVQTGQPTVRVNRCRQGDPAPRTRHPATCYHSPCHSKVRDKASFESTLAGLADQADQAFSGRAFSFCILSRWCISPPLQSARLPHQPCMWWHCSSGTASPPIWGDRAAGSGRSRARCGAGWQQAKRPAGSSTTSCACRCWSAMTFCHICRRCTYTTVRRPNSSFLAAAPLPFLLRLNARVLLRRVGGGASLSARPCKALG